MSPTGLLKIIGALTPLMTDQTIGESMVAEIQQMFEHIEGTAHNLRLIAGHLASIDARLRSLEQKLREHIPTALSDVETEKLIDRKSVV